MLEFIKANEKDAPSLARLKKEAWQQTYRDIYDYDDIYNYDEKVHTDKFLNLIQNKDCNLYLVIYEGERVGYFNFGENLRQFKDFKYYIMQLYLLKKVSGKGIGRQIITFIRERVKEKGENKFFCNCNYYNEGAISFYKKMGGKVTEQHIDNSSKKESQVYIEFEV